MKDRISLANVAKTCTLLCSAVKKDEVYVYVYSIRDVVIIQRKWVGNWGKHKDKGPTRNLSFVSCDASKRSLWKNIGKQNIELDS